MVISGHRKGLRIGVEALALSVWGRGREPKPLKPIRPPARFLPRREGGEGRKEQPVHLLRLDAPLDGAFIAGEHALERRTVLHEPFGGRFVVDGTQGLGIERRKRHVPAGVEADERAHRRAVVVGRGAAHATGCRTGENRKRGDGVPLFTYVPYFLFLLPFTNGTYSPESVRLSEIRQNIEHLYHGFAFL